MTMIQVLRVYDNRFRDSDRKETVYLADSCKTIVGDGPLYATTTVINFGEQHLNALDNTILADDETTFWKPSSPGKRLLVIAIPHREGGHVAQSPRSFLPIIDQLQKLHEAKFVHGDIRAFNTIFGGKGNEDEGYLIDFDFSGEAGEPYPAGYKKELVDGGRTTDPNNTLQKWHDWYALGTLMFYIHEFSSPKDKPGRTVEEELEYLRRYKRFNDQINFWRQIKEDPKTVKIEELKVLLGELEDAGYSVEPKANFKSELKKTNASNNARVGATGSPLKVVIPG